MKNSNTKKILDYFLDGYLDVPGNNYDVIYIMRKAKISVVMEKLNGADIVLIAFPLYFHSMPGMVKKLIENLPTNTDPTKKICFFVQSGFPEVGQFSALIKYFEKLSQRLKYVYLGTIVKGFGESIAIMPAGFNKDWLKDFYRLGQILGEKSSLDQKILTRLKGREEPSSLSLLLNKILLKIGLIDSYAKNQLEKNGVILKDSMAKPLLE